MKLVVAFFVGLAIFLVGSLVTEEIKLMKENESNQSLLNDAIPFQSNIWKSNPSNDVKFKMANDLIAKETLKNLSMQETLALLGQPDNDPNTAERFADFDAFYTLGGDRKGRPMAYESLAIKYSDDGVVTNCNFVVYEN